MKDIREQDIKDDEGETDEYIRKWGSKIKRWPKADIIVQNIKLRWLRW